MHNYLSIYLSVLMQYVLIACQPFGHRPEGPRVNNSQLDSCIKHGIIRLDLCMHQTLPALSFQARLLLLIHFCQAWTAPSGSLQLGCITRWQIHDCGMAGAALLLQRALWPLPAACAAMGCGWCLCEWHLHPFCPFLLLPFPFSILPLPLWLTLAHFVWFCYWLDWLPSKVTRACV